MKNELIVEILKEKGWIRSSRVKIHPLTGGVSSNIFRITDGDRDYVVKQALEKLKVDSDWYADVSRNLSEQDFLRFMQTYIPESVPKVIYLDRERAFFVMEYLDEGYYNWKSRLLKGVFDQDIVALAGKLLGRIHRISRSEDEWKSIFDRYENFYDLRIEPYLVYTGKKYPAMNPLFQEEAERLKLHHEVLIHGDFSPKNIMIHDKKLILLDHEVACYGDPAFDVAFLLTHLFLKMIHHYFRSGEICNLTEVAFSNYLESAAEPDPSALEYRVSRLLLMFLLARVDGKSPVEYLNEKAIQFVRGFASDMLESKSFGLSEINKAAESRLQL